jgi:hypothetical protein
MQLRQCLYVCTSKASKLSTCAGSRSSDRKGETRAGTQFTCFTGTNVQTLTQLPLRETRADSHQHLAAAGAGTHFTCFTGTNVQTLTQLRTQKAAAAAESNDRKAISGANTDREQSRQRITDKKNRFGSSICLLYWYKSACFTGTKVRAD